MDANTISVWWVGIETYIYRKRRGRRRGTDRVHMRKRKKVRMRRNRDGDIEKVRISFYS